MEQFNNEGAEEFNNETRQYFEDKGLLINPEDTEKIRRFVKGVDKCINFGVSVSLVDNKPKDIKGSELSIDEYAKKVLISWLQRHGIEFISVDRTLESFAYHPEGKVVYVVNELETSESVGTDDDGQEMFPIGQDLLNVLCDDADSSDSSMIFIDRSFNGNDKVVFLKDKKDGQIYRAEKRQYQGEELVNKLPQLPWYYVRGERVDILGPEEV